jgi:hypothetical protein
MAPTEEELMKIDPFQILVYAAVFAAGYLTGTSSARAQTAADYAMMDKILDDEFAKRRADFPQQIHGDLYQIKIERLGRSLVSTAKFTTSNPKPTEAQKKKIAEEQVKYICGDPMQKKMLEAGYSVHWRYLDSTGSYVMATYVDITKC